MDALSVASEIYPLIKTGGLADVAGALPGALRREGIRVRSLLPGYPGVLAKVQSAEAVHEWTDLFGGSARLLQTEFDGLELFIIDAPHLFGRAGNPYTDPSGRDWADNAHRFAALGRVAAALGTGLLPGYAPEIVHAHDWQAGLAPAYLHYSGTCRPATVMTVHNLAFQGNFPAGLLGSLGLPGAAFSMEGIEFYGSIGYLKAGLQLADRITTVSPTYALEIRSAEGGMGLDGVLRARSDRVSGILNGIDEAVWNPEADPHLSAPFGRRSVKRRGANKLALQQRFGLAREPGCILFGVISRLSWQKGLDLVLAHLPGLLEGDAQLVVLGAGDAALEDGFRQAASDWPGKLGLQIGYDEGLAHLIQGGSDALLVPSRFEPCGLTQLCAMRYGSVPVVSRLGGLNDTVIDANEVALASGVATGFQFAPVTPEALHAGIARARRAWAEPALWRQIQANGMDLKLGWERPAAQYAALYRSAAAERHPDGRGGNDARAERRNGHFVTLRAVEGDSR